MGKIYNKYTYEDAKKIIDNLDYTLISKEYIGIKHKLIFKDSNEYYYFNNLDNLMHNKTSLKFHKSNPYTIQNIKLWIKINQKPFELISEVYDGNNKYLKWKCLIDDCGEEFESTWGDIYQSKGCPYCVGLKVGLSNCLAIKNSRLASEWHPTKNGNLTPYDVTVSSGKHVWWKCIKGHEWSAEIKSRYNGNGCPYCSGRLPTKENNLLVFNPKLCKEWDYDKNVKKPEEYTPSSGEYVYWICKDCGHKWKTSIDNRHNGTGCPECNKSKGEKECKRVLIYNNWTEINQDNFDKLINEDKHNKDYYIPQKEFKGLIGLKGGLLSYDFYIPKLNLLIEYHGNFHDGTAKGQTEEDYEKQIEHDKRKCEYAQNNNINLLIIWYWDFDKIEEILKRELNILSLKEVM